MLLLFFLFVLSASAQEYSLGPDSQRQPGVLKGAVEEIIPELAKKFNLSNDPDDRAIAGSSSGGIAAFTAARERPDPTLIRKTKPKPPRVFLQDARNDQNIYSGNWFFANLDLASAPALCLPERPQTNCGFFDGWLGVSRRRRCQLQRCCHHK
jgi:hypothetical protein